MFLIFISNVLDMEKCVYICDFKCEYVEEICFFDRDKYDWQYESLHLIWYWVWVIDVKWAFG